MSTTDTASGYEDDAVVVRRILGGEVEAFNDLVQRWQGPLVNMAYRFCRDRSLAEDLAQEAFLKVFRGLGKWRQDGKFSTWLFAVALNHYRGALRRHVPASVALDELSYEAAREDGAALQEQSLRDDAIRRAVATLPPKYREVVVLYYFHEMDLAETARTINAREGTVKARLFRARGLLERKLSTLAGPLAVPREA